MGPLEAILVKPVQAAAALLGTALAVAFYRPATGWDVAFALTAAVFCAIVGGPAALTYWRITDEAQAALVVGLMAALGPALVAIAYAVIEVAKSDPRGILERMLDRVLPARGDKTP